MLKKLLLPLLATQLSLFAATAQDTPAQAPAKQPMMKPMPKPKCDPKDKACVPDTKDLETPSAKDQDQSMDDDDAQNLPPAMDQGDESDEQS